MTKQFKFKTNTVVSSNKKPATATQWCKNGFNDPITGPLKVFTSIFFIQTMGFLYDNILRKHIKAITGKVVISVHMVVEFHGEAGEIQ